MFKIKAILVGFLTEIAIFLVLMAVMASVSVSIGSVSFESYDLFMKIFWVIAVFCGSFICCKIAFEKAIIYASIISGLWLSFALVFVLINGGEVNIINLISQVVITEISAVIGAILGITVKRKKY